MALGSDVFSLAHAVHVHIGSLVILLELLHGIVWRGTPHHLTIPTVLPPID